MIGAGKEYTIKVVDNGYILMDDAEHTIHVFNSTYSIAAYIKDIHEEKIND